MAHWRTAVQAPVLVALMVVVASCAEDKPPPRSPERTVHVPSTGLGGPPDAPGKLPMVVVREHMAEVVAILKACADETTYEGKVIVRVTIDPSGHASAALEEASNDPAIDPCMVGAFEQVMFPESERGQRFQYSYTF